MEISTFKKRRMIKDSLQRKTNGKKSVIERHKTSAAYLRMIATRNVKTRNVQPKRQDETIKLAFFG